MRTAVINPQRPSQVVLRVNSVGVFNGFGVGNVGGRNLGATIEQRLACEYVVEVGNCPVEVSRPDLRQPFVELEIHVAEPVVVVGGEQLVGDVLDNGVFWQP